jgi:hypothetical protein
MQELKDNIQTEVADISIQELRHCSANISAYGRPVTNWTSTLEDSTHYDLPPKAGFACEVPVTAAKLRLEIKNML